jgi:anion-transporting  ArsA/GET3 family ATPase
MNARAKDAATFLDAIVRTKRIVVCCGAGGVGKTTTSAALALAGAIAGRRVLVLTIDPARRLAEAMGIPASSRAPATITRERLEAAGIAKTSGDVDAWMLNPQVVFENMVRRLAPTEEKAAAILSNRLYGHLSEIVSGMQEYTAAEALYTLSTSGTYDLIVLDTPPSRNALEFLEAPRKLSLFLDERIISMFLPKNKERGALWRRATDLIGNVFARIFGEGFYEELQEFMGAFSGMFGGMRSHSESVRALLTSSASSFLLVTSPEPSALAEAAYFEAKIKALGLPFEGYVLNRSWAYTRGFSSPESIELPKDASRDAHHALAKLKMLADEERRRADRDRALLFELKARSGTEHAIATPHLGGAIEDLRGLVMLAESLVTSGAETRQDRVLE